MASLDRPISVMVVEDDAVLRREFEAMIDVAPGMRLLGSAASLAQARRLLQARGAPDVLVVDLRLPDGDGTDLIGQLAQTAPATSALVVTVLGDERHVVRALEAGAKGYLLKEATPEEFARAIRLVHEGGAPLSPMIARYVLKRFAGADKAPARRASEPSVERLTARESEILQLIAQGHSVSGTAKALDLSPHTVSTHIKHIYGKLAVNSRVQAVNRARATGQID